MSRDDLNLQHNTLTNVQYKFEIHSLPHVTFHSQSVILPSIQIDQPMMNTARRDVPLPGSKVNFDPFNLEFIVDKDLNNYGELYNWMISMATEEKTMEKHLSDASLHVLNADLTPNKTIKLINCYPNMISELPFASNVSDSESMIATAIFSFQYFLLPNTKPF